MAGGHWGHTAQPGLGTAPPADTAGLGSPEARGKRVLCEGTE